MKMYFLLFILLTLFLLSGCEFNLPEGVSKNVHSYDDVTRYIKDYLNSDDVIVSTSYVDGKDEYDRKYRIWEATFNNTKFLISSQEESYYDKNIGEFAVVRYTLRNNYNYNYIKDLYEIEKDNFSSINLEYKEKEYLDKYNIAYFKYKLVVNNEEDVKNAFNDAKQLYVYIINKYPEARFSVLLPYEESMQHHVFLDSFKRDDANPYGFTEEVLERAISDFNRLKSK